MIKVGRIYNIPYLGGNIVITWISAEKSRFHCVRQDGFFFEGNIEHQSNFIAEYPTWQEAVNSKEFNGE